MHKHLKTCIFFVHIATAPVSLCIFVIVSKNRRLPAFLLHKRRFTKFLKFSVVRSSAGGANPKPYSNSVFSVPLNEQAVKLFLSDLFLFDQKSGTPDEGCPHVPG